MWYLSGKEPHGTGDGTAVTERAARADIWRNAMANQVRYRAQAAPFPPPWASPFGMPGMMGQGGFPFGSPFGDPFTATGGGPTGGFGPFATLHQYSFQQFMQQQRYAEAARGFELLRKQQLP